MFQSPKSGKFESNLAVKLAKGCNGVLGFNPLNRGNLNQILSTLIIQDSEMRFNPLNRGNLNQMTRSSVRHT